MRLRVTVEYALRAVLYLAQKPRYRMVSLQELSECCGIPAGSLGDVLRQLVKDEILRSATGKQGGYWLTEQPANLTARDVLEAVGEPLFENDCLIHGTPCPQDHWCPVHEIWQAAQKGFLKALESYSLAALADRVKTWDYLERFLENLARGESSSSGEESGPKTKRWES